MAITEKLHNLLQEGEIIRWSGSPQPYSLFDAGRRGGTILSICLAVIWAALSVGAYYALTVSKGGDISLGVVGFCLCISLLILWMPFSDKTRVKKLSYAVTDRNVFVVSAENTEPVVMPIKNVDAVRVDKGDNGNCHVRVGSGVFRASARKLPVMAHRGEYDDQNGKKVYKGVVFFNVTAEDGRIISNLLQKAS